jgi:uncharacterized YccA/Bax inhibitor family protein
VTEHEGRVTCAECLAKLTVAAKSERGGVIGWLMLSVLGLLFAWLLFYYAGAFLSNMPSSFHGGA